MGHSEFDPATRERRPWNAGRMAKRALKLQQVWAIRFWLDPERRLRDRARFDLAIDSKLRGCRRKNSDQRTGQRRQGEDESYGRAAEDGRPVQFELLEAAHSSLQTWLEHRGGTPDDYAFSSRTAAQGTSVLDGMLGWWTNG